MRGNKRGAYSFVACRSPVTIDHAFLQCRDGARRVCTGQAGIACTKCEAP